MMHPRALLVAANLDVVLGGEEFGDTVVEGGKRGDAFVVVGVVMLLEFWPFHADVPGSCGAQKKWTPP